MQLETQPPPRHRCMIQSLASGSERARTLFNGMKHLVTPGRRLILNAGQDECQV